MPIQPGLCSVTFRKLTPPAILDLALQAGLAAIEWGGDVHAPHGDPAKCREIGEMTRAAGLATPSYGSYFRFDPAGLSLEPVLESALALGATTIRVWGGTVGSADLPPAERARLVQAAWEAADLAARAGCEIALEYHGQTVTDTNASAAAFLEEVHHPACRSYWQPRTLATLHERQEGLEAVLPLLAHVHVFEWTGQPIQRHPLSAGSAEWLSTFATIQRTGRLHTAFLEFVENDAPEAFLRDAATLHRLLRETDSVSGIA